jgi:hypothetical protein
LGYGIGELLVEKCAFFSAFSCTRAPDPVSRCPRRTARSIAFPFLSSFSQSEAPPVILSDARHARVAKDLLLVAKSLP